METTIQISEEVRDELKEIKKSNSYDFVLKQLLKDLKRKQMSEDMSEYGEKFGRENLEEVKEWESSDFKW